MIKNTIYYRFSYENKKYKINFDTTEISIGDIKKETEMTRNRLNWFRVIKFSQIIKK